MSIDTRNIFYSKVIFLFIIQFQTTITIAGPPLKDGRNKIFCSLNLHRWRRQEAGQFSIKPATVPPPTHFVSTREGKRQWRFHLIHLGMSFYFNPKCKCYSILVFFTLILSVGTFECEGKFLQIKMKVLKRLINGRFPELIFIYSCDYSFIRLPVLRRAMELETSKQYCPINCQDDFTELYHIIHL